MATRTTLVTFPGGGRYDVSVLNSNFIALRDAHDSLLGTDGTSGDNNTMTGDLDMGGKDILDVGTVVADEITVDGDSIAASVAAAAASATAAATSETNAATSETNAATSETNAAADLATMQANGLTSLTAAEVDQLENINAVTISNAQWVDLGASSASYTAAEETKLSGIETAADKTDVTNVAAAGGLIDTNNLSDVALASTARTNIGVGTGDTPTFAGMQLAGDYTADNAAGPKIINDEAVSVTNPVFIPDKADETTGIGGADGGQNIALITAGLQGLTQNSDASVNNALQPAFLFYNSATDSDVTGNETAATVDFDTEVFDQGSDFATDTFTAPVTGRYSLTANIRFSGITAAADNVILNIITSNRTYRFSYNKTNDIAIDMTFSGTVIADMDAADTVTVTLTVQGESGDVVDVFGSGAANTNFSGCLLA